MSSTTSNTVTASVVRYSDGVRLCGIQLSREEWDDYCDGVHPAFQWPEGLGLAVDVLTPYLLTNLGIDPNTTVYLDC